MKSERSLCVSFMLTALFLFVPTLVRAQQYQGAQVVQACGSAAFPTGTSQQPRYAPFTMLSTGVLCTSAGSGGGGTSGPVYGPDATGASSTKPPIQSGYIDGNGKVQAVTPGTPLPIGAASLPLPTGASTSAKQDAMTTALGSPFQAGGSIGNTAFGISGTLPAFAAVPAFKIDHTTPGSTDRVVGDQGAPAAVANAWPTYLTQGGAALSGTNPIFEQTVGPSMQAPGTAPTIVRGIQGAAAGIPVNTNEQQLAGTALGAPTAIGTAPAAGTVVPNVNASVLNQSTQTTSGALEPPTAAAGKIAVTSTAIAANTSTTIAPANTSRIGLAIQCAGSAGVVISETGAALTSATFGAAGQTAFVPPGSTPYFTPAVATRSAITAYTGTAQTCVVTEYNR